MLPGQVTGPHVPVLHAADHLKAYGFLRLLALCGGKVCRESGTGGVNHVRHRSEVHHGGVGHAHLIHVRQQLFNGTGVAGGAHVSALGLHADAAVRVGVYVDVYDGYIRHGESP